MLEVPYDVLDTGNFDSIRLCNTQQSPHLMTMIAFVIHVRPKPPRPPCQRWIVQTPAGILLTSQQIMVSADTTEMPAAVGAVNVRQCQPMTGPPPAAGSPTASPYRHPLTHCCCYDRRSQRAPPPPPPVRPSHRALSSGQSPAPSPWRACPPSRR